MGVINDESGIEPYDQLKGSIEGEKNANFRKVLERHHKIKTDQIRK